MVFSFPFSLEGKKQRFRFDNQPLFVISPIKSIPFHSSIFQGIICGQLRGSLTFDEDHLRSILGIIYGLGIICGWGSFAVLYYTFHRRTTYCDFYDLKQITKTENFSPTGIAYTIRIYLSIIQQTQPHLFAKVRKHNSKRIFALWRFQQILRRWICLPLTFSR